MVGVSGSTDERALLEIASARSLPAATFNIFSLKAVKVASVRQRVQQGVNCERRAPGLPRAIPT